MKPIVKWAGGKGFLLDTVRKMQPKEYNRYFEPFGGGAAILLGLRHTPSVLNDINSELINVYRQVRDAPDEFMDSLSDLDGDHAAAATPKDFYYDIRSSFNLHMEDGTPEQAARFVYLNKHCFNGLYRVNSSGEFNVPFNGKTSGASFSELHIREVSAFLQTVSITNHDFETILSRAEKGDFVFIDSPYVPIKDNSFTEYTMTGFSMNDHARLADCCARLTQKGVFFLLTNSNTNLVKSLYAPYNMKTIDVARRINRDGTNRKGTEIVITNY